MNPYQFRQLIRAAWAEPFNINYAMILKVPDRFEAIASLRTFATELGARAILLDIEKELNAEQIQMLDRKGPRIAIITGIESLTPEAATGLAKQINSGGRAMPVILWIKEAHEDEEPADDAGDQAIAA